MAYYKPKPHHVRAVQWNTNNFEEVVDTIDLGKVAVDLHTSSLEIQTEHGISIAVKTDWIVQHLDGEILFFTDDLFRETYEVEHDIRT